MEKSWKIKLADETVIEDLTLSGNNFISDIEITKDIFENNLSKVTIEGINEEGQEIKEEHEHMELVQITKYNDKYYFILRDITQDEIDRMKMQADIEYIAMMTDVDLEEE